MVGESWTIGEARSWATENNIKLTVIYRETNSYDPGVVIKQSKTSSDELKSGETLTVTIAKEKQTSSSNTNTNNNTTNNNNSNVTKPSDDTSQESQDKTS